MEPFPPLWKIVPDWILGFLYLCVSPSSSLPPTSETTQGGDLVILCVEEVRVSTRGDQGNPGECRGGFYHTRALYLLSSISVTPKERLAVNLAAGWIFFPVKGERLLNPSPKRKPKTKRKKPKYYFPNCSKAYHNGIRGLLLAGRPLQEVDELPCGQLHDKPRWRPQSPKNPPPTFERS